MSGAIPFLPQNDIPPPTIIDEAIETVAQFSKQETDGKWLEELIPKVAPYIAEWEIAQAYPWSQWPDREEHFPSTNQQDVGIDTVAIRSSDGKHIAIQCKARKLDDEGKGNPIHKEEIDKFSAATSNDFWMERWLVSNGDGRLSDNALKMLSMQQRPVKHVNITSDLLLEQGAFTEEEYVESSPDDTGSDEAPIQTRTAMQKEAVRESIRILREHEACETGGLPIGQARGKIILPCGTGKTRISLRIIEELTPAGELSIVLCPSIALVTQIRREYLQHMRRPIRALAVCSDETAGYDPKKESSRNATLDPTLDLSNMSADHVKGAVTTNSKEIAFWITQGQGGDQISIIFGTYQSGHRVAQALKESGTAATVLIADEAHRTAGLKRRKRGKGAPSEEEVRLRNFTLCHDQAEFPAKYRIYQTATPRIYTDKKPEAERNTEWAVRSMDDQNTFGVDLYRRNYEEAVRNGWLSDYRIIALGVNDPEAYEEANRLARNTKSTGKQKLNAEIYLKGLAFALSMGGATIGENNETLPIQSCIAFMNTVDKSKNMATDLQSQVVRNWVQKWLHDNVGEQQAGKYSLEHLDASSNVSQRENAKQRLATASEENPHGIINVGIFGEGTDSPSLSAIAFLEPRKSPIDVVQAVGRAMRKSPGKEFGYIICPIRIDHSVDPEDWLTHSSPEDGWQELGQILQALRAHDQRIENSLEDLLSLYIPKPPPEVTTIVGIAGCEDGRMNYRQHKGPPGTVQPAIERVLKNQTTLAKEFESIEEPEKPEPVIEPIAPTAHAQHGLFGETKPVAVTKASSQPAQRLLDRRTQEPTSIMSGRVNADGSTEVRQSSAVRDKPLPDGSPGPVNIEKSKKKLKSMVNNGEGTRLPSWEKQEARRERRRIRQEARGMQLLLLTGMDEHGNAIKMNLLSKSGLTGNRVTRDLNILEGSIKEAAHYLKEDNLQPALDQHFQLDNLDADKRDKQADGCTIAALLIMNAAMFHQRIVNGSWLEDIIGMDRLKNDVNIVKRLCREWERILRHDYQTVIIPALEAIYAAEETRRVEGLEKALRHIASEAERIAEAYADMGADHAGPPFNQVMGNQASDGAFFTRPVAASLAARITLDVAGEQDWTDRATWEAHKTVDLACGSGTLLAAMLTEMKRRAREQGADEEKISELQRLAVEETIKGMDINPVSLQLAASQLTAGNRDIWYRNIGLHLMPYGPDKDNPTRVSAGTLELLGQRRIVPRDRELQLPDEEIGERQVWNDNDPKLENAVDSAKGARIIIMNPPFSNRTKMGEKFTTETKTKLRERADSLERIVAKARPDLEAMTNKNALGPLFVTMAQLCAEEEKGILTMIRPTVAMTAPSGVGERQALAKHFHVHTILTCHQPGQINLSQNTAINESILVLRKHNGPKPPTKFINLDRMPTNEEEIQELHDALLKCPEGALENGWGEICRWPASKIEEGDWTPAVWRFHELAEAASLFSEEETLTTPSKIGFTAQETGRVLRGSFKPSSTDIPGSIPILKSKGANGQNRIIARPDETWIPKERDEEQRLLNGGTYPATDAIMEKAGYLLITAGQANDTGRLTATASEEKFVGNGWIPITGTSNKEAKALAVFINSTAGRLQLMRNPGRKLAFPSYSTTEAESIRIPNVKDDRILQILSDCWERTKDMVVPQYRDGEREVRRLWDEAVAEAMGWDPEYLTKLRLLLHQEPHVRGIGYNQYADEVEAPI